MSLEAAETPNESNQKKRKQIIKNGRPVGKQQFAWEIEKSTLFDHEDVKHSTRTGRPVGGQQSTQVDELDFEFRLPGLSHAFVKEAENFRVQELVKKSFSSRCTSRRFTSRITSTTH